MTSQPEVPGAPAVYLFREETTDDHLHLFSIYIRLKVLTERGKEYANVELPYNTGEAGRSIEGIQGRTIHPDGTIIPFTGKPYQKLIEKTQGSKLMASVFTLPDVEVGSILEYRYNIRNDDRYFYSPQWFIQSDLWLRKGHYVWKPVDLNGYKTLIGARGDRSSTVSWTYILPADTEVKQSHLPGSTIDSSDSHTLLQLDVHDIPPAPHEEYMPPFGSLTYRVLFYYSPYRTGDEFWRGEGKYWSKEQDKLIGPGPGVQATVHELTTSSDTQDQKLRRIYAAIMKLENTDYTREHSNAEDMSEGMKEVHTTDDVLARKRGTSNQLAALFVAMARASGMKAWLVWLTDRDRNVFNKNFPSLAQLDDEVVIVSVDGKDQFFDPGSRYCPYGDLAWKHTLTNGIRQVDGGNAAFVDTPHEPYTSSRTQRVANLTIDAHGLATGTIKMTWMGAPALQWRQLSLTGDSSTVDRQLQSTLERLLPQGMDVKVSSISPLEDYEQPLVVIFQVHGQVASSTGKRLLIPADLFEFNTRPAFPQAKRETAISFSYPYMVQDAIRINFPSGLHIESIPTSDRNKFQSFAISEMFIEPTPTNVTVRRNFLLGEILYKPDEYPDLRSFYSKMETKDQESIVLTTSSTQASSAN
jgi:Domain of Unknown Function with PDB structure (DUF3857)/Transglutaminase-like superfamily